MHISEGILSGPVLAAGAVVATAGVAVGLKSMRNRDIPKTALLTSAFFVIALIHVPLGPTNAHLVMNGLVGIILGWCAFPAILVALALQALFFQFGGFTSLGVNVMNMAAPALVCFWLFRFAARGRKLTLFASFLCGFLGVMLGTMMMALCLATTEKAFVPIAKLVVAAHIPVAIVEGIITVAAIGFINRLMPELFSLRENKNAPGSIC